MVGVTIVNQVAMPETGCIKCTRQPPMVHLAALQLIDRAGRCKHPLGLAARQCVQTAKRRCLFLQVDQIALARQRQFGQRAAADTVERIDAGQRLKIVMRRFLGMRHLARQLVHQICFTLFRIAGFERVVKAHFIFLRFFRLTVEVGFSAKSNLTRGPGVAT
jgi:hypothetical protein